jgi:hypothetical protein
MIALNPPIDAEGQGANPNFRIGSVDGPVDRIVDGAPSPVTVNLDLH